MDIRPTSTGNVFAPLPANAGVPEPPALRRARSEPFLNVRPGNARDAPRRRDSESDLTTLRPSSGTSASTGRTGGRVRSPILPPLAILDRRWGIVDRSQRLPGIETVLSHIEAGHAQRPGGSFLPAFGMVPSFGLQHLPPLDLSRLPISRLGEPTETGRTELPLHLRGELSDRGLPDRVSSSSATDTPSIDSPGYDTTSSDGDGPYPPHDLMP